MFFASFLAMGVAIAGACFLLFVTMVGIASLNSPAPLIQDGSILVFNLSGNIQDRPVSSTAEDFIDEAMGKDGAVKYSLYSLTRAIRAAAEDDRIEGILLRGSFRPAGYGTGFASLKEVREALVDFSDSDKPIWASVVYPSSRDMYVMSVADKIYMNPEGMLGDTGMSLNSPYLGAFMEKYGVGVQVTRAGEYKAAAESLILEGMSEPAREANQALLDDLWGEYIGAIAEGSDLSAEGYVALLDEHGLLVASQAKEAGIVDELAFSDKILSDLQEVVKAEDDGLSFRHTSMGSYIKATVSPKYSSDGFVAVIYAEGSIVAGEGNANQVGGARISREIRKARLDENVKAIVLRVNSPGGSALASEVIQHELRLAQEKLPIIVSMGAYAASGGYWISAYADKIYAQPNTITGSIGVIGVFFNFKELADQHGVYFDGVKTTKYADVMSMSRPKTDDEMNMVQTQVDLIYNSFLTKVSEGREMEFEAVKAIAGGRVWSGADALDLGLVDELGGLGDAILYASEQAGLGVNPAVKEYPKAVDFLEELAESLSKSNAMASTSVLSPLVDIYLELSTYADRFNDPKGVYAVLPYDMIIE